MSAEGVRRRQSCLEGNGRNRADQGHDLVRAESEQIPCRNNGDFRESLFFLFSCATVEYPRVSMAKLSPEEV